MTTHLRARAAQAGALLAVVVGGIAVAPAVALADPPTVQITSLPTDLLSGSTVTMQYRVRPPNNTGGGDVDNNASIQVSSQMKCSGDCGQIAELDANGSSFTAQLTAPTVAAGSTQSITIQITAQTTGGTGNTSQTVTVKGPDKPQTVTSVSGKVKDQNGKAIAGASVAMKDSAGNAYTTNTNGSGGYSFNSSASRLIAPGNISVGALKDGYDTATVQVQGTAGKSVTAALTLKAVEASASASPSASVSASASANAIDEATEEPTTEDSAPAGTDAQNTSSDQSGGGSMLFIVLGGLLVAAGVGAIVLVLMRRKSNGGDDGPDDDLTVMGGGPGGAVPPSQGRFNDATRVAAPMRAGPDATMMAPRPASSPMADAPTMLQRPVEEEFPDPYGAPVPQQGGYAGGGGWDDQGGAYGGNQYAEPTQYGRPQEDDGYGGGTYGAAQPGGTYGAAPVGGGTYGAAQQRYDEPTGMYRPESGQESGYDEYDQRGGYGGGQYGAGAAGGYEDQGGGYGGGQYGGGQAGANGYAPQPGAGTYGSAAPAGGTYGGGGQQYGGYDQSGYADQGGYDQHGGQQHGGQQYGGGYDQGGYPDQGYDQRGGYNEPPNRRPHEPSGQRRTADWMEN